MIMIRDVPYTDIVQLVIYCNLQDEYSLTEAENLGQQPCKDNQCNTLSNWHYRIIILMIIIVPWLIYKYINTLINFWSWVFDKAKLDG